MLKDQLIIIGTGEMARDLANLAEATGRFDRDSIAFLSTDIKGTEKEVDGIRVRRGALSTAKEIAEDTSGPLPVFINGMGHVESWRKEVPKILSDTGLKQDAFTSLIHPTVLDMKAPDAEISPYGAAVFPGTVLGGGARIGPHSLVLPGGTWGRGASMGMYGTAESGVQVEGYVQIGKCVYLDTGSVIKRGTEDAPRRIGDGSIIGPNAVVDRDVFPNSKVTMPSASYRRVRLKP